MTCVRLEKAGSSLRLKLAWIAEAEKVPRARGEAAKG